MKATSYYWCEMMGKWKDRKKEGEVGKGREKKENRGGKEGERKLLLRQNTNNYNLE